MEAKALVHRKIDKLLDNICRYIELCEERVKVEAYARLDAVAHTLAEMKPQKFSFTLADLEYNSYTLVEAGRYV